jgi:hypothetical protein
MAVAAGLAAAAVLGLWNPGATPRATDVPTVSMSLDEPQTVRLVFAADAPLEHAVMTLTLPAGIELDGFPGEHEIRWETSLAAGRNLLPLTLLAVSPEGGEVRAHLQHDSRDRTFRLRVKVG